MQPTFMSDRRCYGQCSHIMCMNSYKANINPFPNLSRGIVSVTRRDGITRIFIKYNLQKKADLISLEPPLKIDRYQIKKGIILNAEKI